MKTSINNFYNSKTHVFSNFHIIPKESKYFPKNLLSLQDCPDILFVLGNKEILNSFCISIVGTRNSSALGNKIAFDFSKELSNNGITIASGMASGIDTNAHLGALNKTIAVIACGFEHIFSKKNNTIIENIINSGGAIISEYFPNTPPQKFTFLDRNRLIAAISEATIIVEAPLKSGALNTVQTAQTLDKPVFSVPWNINLSKGQGCNKLIENGSHILLDSNQILNYFNKLPQTQSSQNLLLKTEALNIISSSSADKSSKINSNIPSEYLPIYKYIYKNDYVTKNDIYLAFVNESISALNSKLTLMEINNLIKFEDTKYHI